MCDSSGLISISEKNDVYAFIQKEVFLSDLEITFKNNKSDANFEKQKKNDGHQTCKFHYYD